MHRFFHFKFDEDPIGALKSIARDPLRSVRMSMPEAPEQRAEESESVPIALGVPATNQRALQPARRWWAQGGEALHRDRGESTIPSPSTIRMPRFARTLSKLSVSPVGHRTVTASASRADPRPKCKRKSFCE